VHGYHTTPRELDFFFHKVFGGVRCLYLSYNMLCA